MPDVRSPRNVSPLPRVRHDQRALRLQPETPMTEPAPTRRSRRNDAAQAAALGVEASVDEAIAHREIDAPTATTIGRPELIETHGQASDASGSVAAPMTRRRARRVTQPGTPVFADAAGAAGAGDVEERAAVLPTAIAPAAPAPVDLAPAATAPRAPASSVDEFAAAARLFCFTGETAIQPPADASATPEVVGIRAEAAEDEAVTHAAPRRARRAVRAPRTRGAGRVSARRIAAASFSLSAMTIVGLLTVGMTVPAQAVAAVNGASTTASAAGALDADTIAGASKDGIQAYVAPSQVQNESLDREGSYSTATTAQMATDLGIQNFSTGVFRNNPNSNIQWPFAVGVPISYGFGPRPGGFHHGVDFTPGQGAEVQAIADGVVRYAEDGNGVFGVNVLIDHIIDGKLVSSHYCHMEHGSLKVKTGDRVKVGQLIGLVGATGFAFGAHLHFEIWADGSMDSRIDPLAWLYKYTTGTHTVTG